MRGAIDGLVSPQPIGLTLPSPFHGDTFVQRFTQGLDEVLAPLITSLDSIHAYLDPTLSPEDFLPWLASLVGIEPDGNWSIEQQRRMISRAVALARWHGTRQGLIDLVCAYGGVDSESVEVEDTGGVVWSTVPGSPPPAPEPPSVTVRMRGPNAGAVDVGRVERLVAAAKPAHVAHHVQVEPG